MEDIILILSAVIICFAGAASAFFIRLNKHYIYHVIGLIGVVLFLIFIILPHSFLSDIAGLIGLFMLIYSLASIFRLRFPSSSSSNKIKYL